MPSPRRHLHPLHRACRAHSTTGDRERRFGGVRIEQFKRDEESLPKFIKRHMSRLLKENKLARLGELEIQEEFNLSVKICDERNEW